MPEPHVGDVWAILARIMVLEALINAFFAFQTFNITWCQAGTTMAWAEKLPNPACNGSILMTF